MKKEVAFLLLGVGIGLLGGILLGFVMQQMLFTASAIEFGESLEGVDIEVNVDINETIMVNKLIEFFNETLNENKTS